MIKTRLFTIGRRPLLARVAATEDFVQGGVHIVGNVHPANDEGAGDRQYDGFQQRIDQHDDKGRHTQRCQQRQQQGVPSHTDTKEQQHQDQDVQMFDVEDADFKFAVYEPQQADEIKGIREQRGAGRAVDAPKRYEPVVEQDGRDRQQCYEYQRERIFPGIVEYVGAYAERRVDNLGHTEEEHDTHSADVFGTVGNDGKECPQVCPD